jgi:hypothetical protein
MGVILLKWLISCILSEIMFLAGIVAVSISELGENAANILLATILMLLVGIWFFMKHQNSK